MSPDHLLVEVSHHLLKDNISGLICLAKFLQDLRKRQEVMMIGLVSHFSPCTYFRSISGDMQRSIFRPLSKPRVSSPGLWLTPAVWVGGWVSTTSELRFGFKFHLRFRIRIKPFRITEQVYRATPWVKGDVCSQESV